MNFRFDLCHGGLLLLRLTSRRLHDDRPARGVKARRALHWRNMVAFHEEVGLLPTIAGETMFRNKIPETLEPRRLCNGMKSLIPAIIKTPLGRHCETRHSESSGVPR